MEITISILTEISLLTEETANTTKEGVEVVSIALMILIMESGCHFPRGVKSLDISIDIEQNSLVRGDALKIEKFKKFIKKIDQPIPLIMIEVMLIEVNKSTSVSAG